MQCIYTVLCTCKCLFAGCYFNVFLFFYFIVIKFYLSTVCVIVWILHFCSTLFCLSERTHIVCVGGGGCSRCLGEENTGRITWDDVQLTVFYLCVLFYCLCVFLTLSKKVIHCFFFWQLFKLSTFTQGPHLSRILSYSHFISLFTLCCCFILHSSKGNIGLFYPSTLILQSDATHWF